MAGSGTAEKEFVIDAAIVELVRKAAESTETLISRSEMAGMPQGEKAFMELTKESRRVGELGIMLIRALRNRSEELKRFELKPEFAKKRLLREIEESDSKIADGVQEMLGIKNPFDVDRLFVSILERRAKERK
ncbi:MAG: hypothetical protein ABSD68_02885 [Candidatus Micrarchaeales archaeon]|jgi:tRNA isopentenyl-2-thiomethyl-A-37 hydroxylase MiaE